MLNGLSVDVEEAFHASAFETECPPESWAARPQRAAENTRKLLAIFAQHGVKATFFTLGWVAERQPALIREIVAQGHELACHGYAHRRIYTQSREVFRQDVSRAKQVLEDLSGIPVRGYRAPTYSITRASLWALDVLAELGFQYDSSIFPVRHDRYGIPEAPRFPHRLLTPSGAALVEIPPTSFRLGNTQLPVLGGGYLRLFPLALHTAALRYINQQEHQPTFVYVHPWEVDEAQPVLSSRRLSWWRHTVNIPKVPERLTGLLQSASFAPFCEVLQHVPTLKSHRLH